MLTYENHEHIILKDGHIIDEDYEIIVPILNNPSLRNKPKLFIIDSLKRNQDFFETDTLPETRFPNKIMRCYSSTKGFNICENRNYESFFIKVFITKLMNNETETVKKIMEDSIGEVYKKTK